jgi:hypothetical protein
MVAFLIKISFDWANKMVGEIAKAEIIIRTNIAFFITFYFLLFT